jgi:hypothetical protein
MYLGCALRLINYDTGPASVTTLEWIRFNNFAQLQCILISGTVAMRTLRVGSELSECCGHFEAQRGTRQKEVITARMGLKQQTLTKLGPFVRWTTATHHAQLLLYLATLPSSYIADKNNSHTSACLIPTCQGCQMKAVWPGI